MDGGMIATGDKWLEKFLKLLDNIGDFKRECKFNSEQIEMIRELANSSPKSKLFEETREQASIYRTGLTAEEVYMDMVMKIAEAPTRIHAIASAHLLIPEVYMKIQEELKNEEWFEGTEMCGDCGREFDFIFYPSRGEHVYCPECGLIQHPCSLCNGCDNRCNENLHNIHEEE